MPDGEPSHAFKPLKTKGNMDAGCRKVWDRRAPGVKDYAYREPVRTGNNSVRDSLN